MKTADLYVRVSTDEQADKGYSVRSQEEVLRKYCSLQNIAGDYDEWDHTISAQADPLFRGKLTMVFRGKLTHQNA